TAICDVNQAKAEKVARKFAIPHFFKEYEDMFSTMALEAVVICTPNKFHADITIAALKARAHVLCEKQIAMNRLEGQKMINDSKKADKLLSVGYYYRYNDEACMA